MPVTRMYMYMCRCACVPVTQHSVLIGFVTILSEVFES